MKKILQVVGSMNRGGAETLLMNVLRKIPTDYKFYFLCYSTGKYDYENEIISNGGEIIRIDTVKNIGIFNHIKQIKYVIKKYDIDIVHTHNQLAAIYAVIAAYSVGVKKIIVHSHLTSSGKGNNLLRMMYEKISKFIIQKYATDKVACGFDAGAYLFHKNFTVINNGIDLENFSFKPQNRGYRSSNNISDDCFLIGHVGRFEIQKNHDFLIDVFAEYLKINPKSKLMLAGQGSLEDKIKNKVKDLNIMDKVIFLGLVEDTVSLYNSLDLMLLPSLYEGLPVVMVEAQANGLSIISSANVDPKSKISDNVEFLPINQGVNIWVNEINNRFNKKSNRNSVNIDSEYDILTTVKKFENLYDK